MRPDPSAIARELAVESIQRFGQASFAVTGSSMLPALRPHDLVHVRRCPAHGLVQGDVVVVMRETRLYAHRVVGRQAGAILTRGDTLAHADPPVPPGAVVGRVVGLTRRGASMPVVRPGLVTRLAARALRLRGLQRLFTAWHEARR